MQGGDESKQKFIWIGLIILAFIAGAVVSMAGLRSVSVPSGGQPAPQAHAPAAHGGDAGH